MNKNSYAIAFALIGVGVGGFFSAQNGSFIPVLLGLCFGVFVGYFVAGLFGASSTILQKNFKKAGDLRGRTIEDITSVVGDYSTMQPCNITDRREEGVIYTWTEPKYEIALLFGADGLCIGVNRETKL